MGARIHQVEQHRSTVPGVDARTLFSNHHFPRHSHDQFGLGVLLCGAQRSWSGVGLVEAVAGDVIMVNPGEIHDGAPLDGQARGWRMIYFDAALITREIAEENVSPVEMLRPAVRDPLLAGHFARLFACVTDGRADALARQENLLRLLTYTLRRHGTARLPSPLPLSSVAKARARLDSSPEMPTSLAELAALSGVSRFQFLRSFARQVGITPHAYLVQRRVRLVQRLLRDRRTPAEAALAAGFADQSHMTRAFVRQLGITPRTYQAAIT